MSFDRNQWNGRPVRFAEFNIREGRAVREAFRVDGETGSWSCLVQSLRYADTDEPVFASVDEIEAQPFRLQARLIYLAGEAAKVNGMLDADEGACASQRQRGGCWPSPLAPERVMLHRLALALHRTVGELEATMTEREFVDWHRFEALHEPLPDRLADLHHAVLCSIAVNLMRSSDAAPVAVTDFFCIQDRAPPPRRASTMSEAERQKINWRGGFMACCDTSS
jgi:hypothetical protein